MFKCRFEIINVPLDYKKKAGASTERVEIEGMLPFVPWEGMPLENWLVLRGSDGIAVTLGAVAWRYDEQTPQGYFHSAACEFMGEPSTVGDLEITFRRIGWTTTVLR